jgi:hypothetical protein
MLLAYPRRTLQRSASRRCCSSSARACAWRSWRRLLPARGAIAFGALRARDAACRCRTARYDRMRGNGGVLGGVLGQIVCPRSRCRRYRRGMGRGQRPTPMSGWVIPPPSQSVKSDEDLRREREAKLRARAARAALLGSPPQRDVDRASRGLHPVRVSGPRLGRGSVAAPGRVGHDLVPAQLSAVL